MKLGVVSDIHGNLAALQAVRAALQAEGCDAIVNLGDCLSGPLQPAETAALLMADGWPTVAGNHERQLLRARARPLPDPATSDGYAALQVSDAQAAWLAGLPAHRWLDAEVLLVHGTPADDLQFWLETVTPDGLRMASADEVRARLEAGPLQAGRAALVLCGHTHVPRAVRCGGTLVVNPGSVGLQAYDDAHPHPYRVETGSPDARYAVVERTSAGWTARLCSLPYDHAAASATAARRGRADWAYALATGRLPAAAATIAA